MGKYHTQDGKIYIHYNDGYWRQNVNYLAGVPTQYNCTTYEEQFEKIISHIENGKLRCMQASGQRFRMVDGRLYRETNKTPYRPCVQCVKNKKRLHDSIYKNK